MNKLKKQMVVAAVVCVGMWMIVVAKSKDGKFVQEKPRVNGQRLERRIEELSNMVGSPMAASIGWLIVKPIYRVVNILCL